MTVAVRELCLRRLPRLASRVCVASTCLFSTNPPPPPPLPPPPPPPPPPSNTNPKLHGLSFGGTKVESILDPGLLLDIIRQEKSARSNLLSSSPFGDSEFQPASIDDASATNPDADAQHSQFFPVNIPLQREAGYFFVHAVATTRNIHVTITNHEGNTLVTMSAGQTGLKHSKRGTVEAGIETSTRAFQKLADSRRQIDKVEIVLKGFNKGRFGFLSALMGQQGDFLREKVVRITDATPLRIGSTRVKNRRRR